ncbi:unnamed protein product [Pleuronectes platessa]|uniref:Uncharacterized protein n=1 Tax=Pleuronectes platessa TaxID=8262 RepID=A0A9N7W071_PLEPL|nr:unnamed protein product [Pleuronectes platessa]
MAAPLSSSTRAAPPEQLQQSGTWLCSQGASPGDHCKPPEGLRRLREPSFGQSQYSSRSVAPQSDLISEMKSSVTTSVQGSVLTRACCYTSDSVALDIGGVRRTDREDGRGEKEPVLQMCEEGGEGERRRLNGDDGGTLDGWRGWGGVEEEEEGRETISRPPCVSQQLFAVLCGFQYHVHGATQQQPGVTDGLG